MAELLANSPVPGVRAVVGELAGELALAAKGAKALKLTATFAKRTGLRKAGSTTLLIVPAAGGEGELIRITTAPGEPTEYEILARGVEESTEKAWPAGSKVYALPTLASLLAWLIAELEATGFTQLQVLNVVAAVAKGGKTLNLSSYLGNEVAKIALSDTNVQFVGPTLWNSPANFTSAEESIFRALKTGLTIEAWLDEAVSTGLLAYSIFNRPKERGRIRLRGGSPIGLELAGLAEAAKGGTEGQIMNVMAEPVRFTHQAEVSQGGVQTARGEWKAATAYAKHDGVTLAGFKYVCVKAMNALEDVEPPNEAFWREYTEEAVPTSSRIITPGSVPLDVPTNGIAAYSYDIASTRWRVWRIA